jgi:thiamine-phosphate pyrophosphorylase
MNLLFSRPTLELMAQSPLLYYITSRAAFPGDEQARCSRLLEKIEEAAGCGIDYIQLREKDLPIRELESLAREAVRIIRNTPKKTRTENRELRTRLLINSRTDVALAVGSDGVHLPAGDISPTDVRKAWKDGASQGDARILRSQFATSNRVDPLIAVSCHSPEEVIRAAASRATFAVFAPVFEKKEAPGTMPAGLNALRQACRANIPVFALGGVTLLNAKSCLDAGAAGIAGIRLFQENDVATIVRELHEH